MYDIVLPETYNYNMSCENCQQTSFQRIPIGTTVLKHAEGRDCPHCGCKMDGRSEGQTNFKQSPTIYVPMLYPFRGTR